MAKSVKDRVVLHALPTDEKILVTVGTIALRHGQLDNALKMVIQFLTGVDMIEVFGATARDSSRQLRDRVHKLARQHLGEGPALVRLQARLARAGRASEQRNKLIHAVWGSELDSGPVMLGDDHELRPVPSVVELQKLDHEIILILEGLIDAGLEGFLLEASKKPARKPRAPS